MEFRENNFNKNEEIYTMWRSFIGMSTETISSN